MKKKKKLITILSIILVVAIGFTVMLYLGFFDPKEKVENKIEEVVELSDNSDPNRDLWLANKAINIDYCGEIVFDSGLVNKPFVQATDVYDKNNNLYRFYNEDGSLVIDPSSYTGNDVYIYMNWKTMAYDYNDEGGSVFMDYRNTLSDQNIIIYGHHFSNPNNDPKKIKAFTPLEKLLEEVNYKDNNKVKLVLDNETRSYELAYVYIFDTNDEYDLENLQYYRTTYNYDDFKGIVDDNYYQNYIEAMEEAKLYDTGVSLNTDDYTLTLQTCIGGTSGERLQICVFKLLDTKYYEG